MLPNVGDKMTNTEHDTIPDLEDFPPRKQRHAQSNDSAAWWGLRQRFAQEHRRREEGWRNARCWVGFSALRRTVRVTGTLAESCCIREGKGRQPWEEAEGREGFLGWCFPMGCDQL